MRIRMRISTDKSMDFIASKDVVRDLISMGNTLELLEATASEVAFFKECLSHPLRPVHTSAGVLFAREQ